MKRERTDSQKLQISQANLSSKPTWSTYERERKKKKKDWQKGNSRKVDQFSLVLELSIFPLGFWYLHEGGTSKKQCRAQFPQDPLPNLPHPPTDLQDMSQMILRTKGPDRLPAGYEIVLYISMSDSDKVGVFYVESE